MDVYRKINEYDLMKIICVILVVIGHILNLYISGGAILIAKEQSFIPMRDFIYSFHMPVFVALSGAIYSIQKEKGKYMDNFSFLRIKIKRLLVPYILISLCFVLPTMCFVWNIKEPFNYYYNNYVLARDSRHLWFLLMLFYVFVILNPIERQIRTHKRLSCLLFFVCSYFISSYIPNVFGVHFFFKYVFWFYFGYLFERNKHIIISFLDKLWVFFFLYLAFAYYFSFYKATFNTPLCFCFLYYICSNIKARLIERADSLYKKIVDNSMGIYLFHPMILYIFAYYLRKSSVGCYISFIILLICGLLISYLFTVLVRKMKMGFILGE